MDVPSSPLPLVTVTFTTEELAMAAAGLIQLRKVWASHATDVGLMGGDTGPAYATIESISAFINRIYGMVSAEQGSALLGTLISELKKRPY